MRHGQCYRVRLVARDRTLVECPTPWTGQWRQARRIAKVALGALPLGTWAIISRCVLHPPTAPQALRQFLAYLNGDTSWLREETDLELWVGVGCGACNDCLHQTGACPYRHYIRAPFPSAGAPPPGGAPDAS